MSALEHNLLLSCDNKILPLVRLQKQAVRLFLCLFIGYKITDSSLPLKYTLLRQIATQTDKVPPFLKAFVLTLFFAENWLNGGNIYDSQTRLKYSFKTCFKAV